MNKALQDLKKDLRDAEAFAAAWSHIHEAEQIRAQLAAVEELEKALDLANKTSIENLRRAETAERMLAGTNAGVAGLQAELNRQRERADKAEAEREGLTKWAEQIEAKNDELEAENNSLSLQLASLDISRGLVVEDRDKAWARVKELEGELDAANASACTERERYERYKAESINSNARYIGLNARITSLESDNARLREALKLVLNVADAYGHDYPGTMRLQVVACDCNEPADFTLGDLRRAHEATEGGAS